MSQVPQPTNHVLRPHHVNLLTIFMLTFREGVQEKLPASFILHVYRVLLSEVSEAKPRSREELFRDLTLGRRTDSPDAEKLRYAWLNAYRNLQTPDDMTNFFHNVPGLYLEKSEDDDPPILLRRSIFGYFCRRCFVSFVKLSFSAVVNLTRDYQAWTGGNLRAGYGPLPKEHIYNAERLLFRTQGDRNIWAQPDTFSEWEKELATGDENYATENLRRFFEQHFHESHDSGFRQHAVLNLVRMHYIRQEYPAARKVAIQFHIGLKAIAVARTSGDKITLQHCISLKHRMPPITEGTKPVLNEIQPNLHPLEVLFDISKLMTIENEQPLSASFEKLVQAVGLYDHCVDAQTIPIVEAEQWGQHAVQSVLWSAAGSEQLAAIEENIVTAFTEVGGEDNNRFTVTLNRAYKHARQGRYEDGLATLLDPDVWRGISVNDYMVWSNEIWQILILRATRRGQMRLYHEFLLPRQPPGQFNPREYVFDGKTSVPSVIRDHLLQFMLARRSEQPTNAVEKLLVALWRSEFQGRMDFYRTGMVLLADVGMEFGMTKRSRRILEEIMPQVINGDDLEQRALACFVFARCIIASADDDSAGNALHEALGFLRISESDYASLEMLSSLMDVQYLLSVVYHNLDMHVQQREASARHFSTKKDMEHGEEIVVENQVTEVWKVVTEVGAALALR
ncbi:hypothetical protein PLICRDRAFT_110769 [Plicaturopsis crispa FD-325 SS-3]|nr:hypothetical protein PLICRDRAFT_110769 [Plicaturopsis crispa FD-325 SS-3]